MQRQMIDARCRARSRSFDSGVVRSRLAGGVVALGLALPLVVSAESPERGRLLYENHCTECHESSVHIRERSSVKNIEDLHAYVARWRRVLKLEWRLEEHRDVVAYLKGGFYDFDDEPAMPTTSPGGRSSGG